MVNIFNIEEHLLQINGTVILKFFEELRVKWNLSGECFEILFRWRTQHFKNREQLISLSLPLEQWFLSDQFSNYASSSYIILLLLLKPQISIAVVYLLMHIISSGAL